MMVPKGVLKAHKLIGSKGEDESSHASTDSASSGKTPLFIAPPSKPAPPAPPGGGLFVPPGMEPKIEPPGGHHTVLTGVDSEADLKLALQLPVGFDTMADLKVAQKAGRLDKTAEQKAAGALMKGFGGM